MRTTDSQPSKTSLNAQLAASQQPTPSLDDVIAAGRIAWQWWQLTKDFEAELEAGAASQPPAPEATDDQSPGRTRCQPAGMVARWRLRSDVMSHGCLGVERTSAAQFLPRDDRA
jgi:hypothetical protein